MKNVLTLAITLGLVGCTLSLQDSREEIDSFSIQGLSSKSEDCDMAGGPSNIAFSYEEHHGLHAEWYDGNVSENLTVVTHQAAGFRQCSWGYAAQLGMPFHETTPSNTLIPGTTTTGPMDIELGYANGSYYGTPNCFEIKAYVVNPMGESGGLYACQKIFVNYMPINNEIYFLTVPRPMIRFRWKDTYIFNDGFEIKIITPSGQEFIKLIDVPGIGNPQQPQTMEYQYAPSELGYYKFYVRPFYGSLVVYTGGFYSDPDSAIYPYESGNPSLYFMEWSKESTVSVTTLEAWAVEPTPET